MCDLMVARRTVAGRGRRITRGTVLCECDPAVLRAPGVFDRYDVAHHCGNPKSGPVVEQATAAPGERRTVRPPAEGPRRPPTSGPGSGVETWRRYAGQVTGTPEAELDELSRDELIDLVS